MSKLKYDFRGMLSNAAHSLARKDGGTAYALCELSDNLAALLRGECTVEEFYVGWDQPKLIRDGLMPGEKGYELRAPA